MKKFIMISTIILITLTISGCFKKDTMEGITIHTTVYPIEYITNYLYGVHANIVSVYPNNIEVDNYRLTNKQLTDYSNGDLYIYNGLSNEKDYAIEMLNMNRNLKIIDAAMNMEYSNGIEELWMNPSNFLMLAQNIKKGFEEYITNPYLKNEINSNYDKIKIELSEIDAELNLIATNAENKTLVISNNIFMFLEKYGFNIISLEEGSVTAKKIADVKDLVSKGMVKYVFIKGDSDINDTISDLINNHGVSTKTLKTGANLTEQERYDKINFIDIMNENIELLKSELYQ